VSNNSINLATSGAGGSDEEIEKTSIGGESRFVIKVPYDTTTNWEDNGFLEIKIDTGEEVGGKAEILRGYKGNIKFIDSELDWESDIEADCDTKLNYLEIVKPKYLS
jgi:hypothetical protein